MSVHIDRAFLLIEQRRYSDAEKEVGMALAEDPDNPPAPRMNPCDTAR